MKTKLLLTTLLSFSFYLLSSQIPQGFNYQAIARNASGDPITDQMLPVRITIQSDSLGGTICWIEEHSSVTTNGFGLFTLILGKGVRQTGSTVATFNDIDWTVTPKFIKTEINYSGWKTMGSSRLWAVPYSMVSGTLAGPLKKLAVTGETSVMDEALFEVKNKNGQTVFAVYNEGVRIYVDDGVAKGATKGGFAIGGFGTVKSPSQRYLYINNDSIRMYIDNTASKGATKGGFAIGGFNEAKGFSKYLNVTPDSTRIFTVDSLKGFGVGNIASGKSESYLKLTPSNYLIGHQAGSKITLGKFNSIIGFQSGFSNNTGYSNSFFGYKTGYKNTSGFLNVFIGNNSGFNNLIGNSNTFIGPNAGFTNTDGSGNTFIGPDAGYHNTTGGANVFIGQQAGYANTTGERAVAIGLRAGLYHQVGEGSVYIGYEAGSGWDGSNTNAIVTAQYNTFIGTYTGKTHLTGDYNTFLGFQTGIHPRGGSRNTFLGAWIMRENIISSQPDDNVYVGYGVAMTNQEGDRNVMIGSSAGYNSGTNPETSGSVFIGYQAGFNETTSNKLYIENSDANSSNALIYGEFDNDKLKLNALTSIRDALILEPRSIPPSSPVKGMMYFDSTDNKLKVYDGTIWRSLW